MSIIPRDWSQYVQTGIFGLLVFGGSYTYIRWLGMSNELNKSAADTAIILICLSMIISSVSYFFNFFDWTVAYRKHLGLIGFAFALAHLFLSSGAFFNLLKLSTWQQGKMWPILTGLLALLIFATMALVSNSKLAVMLGHSWRPFLRIGYVAVFLVFLHVWLLKSTRWITWYQGGMKTSPSLSLLVAIFALIVLIMRVVLWLSLRRQAKVSQPRRK